MYRVALCAGLSAVLAACSLGSSSISSGFAESTPPAATASVSKPHSAALGGEAVAARDIQLAKLDDKAPPGTYEHTSPEFCLTGTILTPVSVPRWRATSSMRTARNMA